MRAIFILLLAANIIFFGYHFFSKSYVIPTAKVVSEMGRNIAMNGDGLKLVTESNDGAQLSKRALDARQVDAAPREMPASELCTMIGPYSQLLQAEYALERLASLGVVAHITPVEIKEGELYWVHLRPEASEKEALRRLYELQGKGIESHVISKGELTNGISFGRFADYAQAEVRVREMKDLGYDVDIKMLPRVIRETWLVVGSDFDEKIDEAVWGSLLSKEESLEKRQNFCLGVDSP